MKRDKNFRIHQKERIIKKRIRGFSDDSYDNTFVIQPNRCVKQHPNDCGHANCRLCRYSKKEFSKKPKENYQFEDITNE